MAEKHSIMGDKVHVYRRDNSGKWQCSTFLEGKNHRVTTGTDSLSLAEQFAEDWYFGLRLKQKDGKLKREKTFRDAAEQFQKEFNFVTGGTRNQKYVSDNYRRLNLYLIPFSATWASPR